MLKKLIIIILALCLLGGCNQTPEIHYQAFAIGLGIDFKDDRYLVYMQFLDFSQVSHQESAPGRTNKPTWISIGEGKTIGEAMEKIYHTMQIYTTFEHLSLFIMTENALKHRLNNITESLNTIYSMRTNGYVYSTDLDIKDIFAAKQPFYYPATDSQLHQPKNPWQGNPIVPPVGVEDFLITLSEDTRTTLLPKITLNDHTFKVNKSNIPIIEVSGAVVLNGDKVIGSLEQKDLLGYAKFNRYTKRSLIQVKYADIQDPVSMEILDTNITRKVVDTNGHPEFKLEISMEVVLRESAQKKRQATLRKKAEDQIKSEILHSIKCAQEKGIDIYQFEDYLYRYHHHLWANKQFTDMMAAFDKEDIILKFENVKSPGKIYN